MKRKPRPYEEAHKIVDGITYKLCSHFNEWYPMTEEYFYKNKSSPDGYNPYCKEATKIKSLKRYDENREQDNIRRKQWYEDNKEHTLHRQKISNEKNMENNKLNQSKWRKEHPDKLKEYRIERNMHKSHNISDDELNELYQYCNYSCMYCGISEKEHKEIHNQVLHKDHAINDGSEGIDNCVLACKSCNSSKNTKDWDEWYTPDNPKYTEERYIKIKEWLDKFTI